MLHPDTRVVVIVVGDKSDPATDEDADTIISMIKVRTGLKAHTLSDQGAVNRIVYHLAGVPGFR